MKGKAVVETFRSITGYWLGQLTVNSPSCFNGVVSIKRYKITVEEIDDPKEVLAERLEKLYRESDNHHHVIPLMNAAKELNYQFIGKFGQDAKK